MLLTSLQVEQVMLPHSMVPQQLIMMKFIMYFLQLLLQILTSQLLILAQMEMIARSSSKGQIKPSIGASMNQYLNSHPKLSIPGPMFV